MCVFCCALELCACGPSADDPDEEERVSPVGALQNCTPFYGFSSSVPFTTHEEERVSRVHTARGGEGRDARARPPVTGLSSCRAPPGVAKIVGIPVPCCDPSASWVRTLVATVTFSRPTDPAPPRLTRAPPTSPPPRLPRKETPP